jgi:uncharacterized protein YdeI (YjbR/CyaY-like superfamily)
MKPIFFSNQLEFREWLQKNHNQEAELFVGFYKVHTRKPSMTWSESVDQALCFGWIDGVRRSIDQDSYYNRFTPRKKNSNWSTLNIQKVEELTKKGLMMPAGIEAFSYRKEEKSNVYSFEGNPKTLKSGIEKLFQSNKAAWNFFTRQAPFYQRTTIHWIMSAKQEKTRRSRLEKLMAACEKQKRL